MMYGIDFVIIPAHIITIPIQLNHFSLCFKIGMERRAQNTIDVTFSMVKKPPFFMKPRPVYPRDTPIMSKSET